MEDDTIFAERRMVRLSDGLPPLRDVEDHDQGPSLDFSKQPAPQEYVPPLWLADVNLAAFSAEYPFPISIDRWPREEKIQEIMAWASVYTLSASDTFMFAERAWTSAPNNRELVYSRKLVQSVRAIRHYQDAGEGGLTSSWSREKKVAVMLGAVSANSNVYRETPRNVFGRSRLRADFESQRTHAVEALHNAYRYHYLESDEDIDTIPVREDMSSEFIESLRAKGDFEQGYLELLELWTETGIAYYSGSSAQVLMRLMMAERSEGRLGAFRRYSHAVTDINRRIRQVRSLTRWLSQPYTHIRKIVNPRHSRETLGPEHLERYKQELESIIAEFISLGYESYLERQGSGIE